MRQAIAAWICFWWLPLTRVHWDGKRWVQHGEELPEWALLALGLCSVVLTLVLALVAFVLLVMLWRPF